jgi:hypothetical protein
MVSPRALSRAATSAARFTRSCMLFSIAPPAELHPTHPCDDAAFGSAKML